MSNCECKGCAHNTRQKQRADIYELTASMNTDELRVLASVAEGLVNGRKIYGALETSTDKRDMLREGLEEVRDALVYVGTRLVQLEQ